LAQGKAASRWAIGDVWAGSPMAIHLIFRNFGYFEGIDGDVLIAYVFRKS